MRLRYPFARLLASVLCRLACRNARSGHAPTQAWPFRSQKVLSRGSPTRSRAASSSRKVDPVISEESTQAAHLGRAGRRPTL